MNDPGMGSAQGNFVEQGSVVNGLYYTGAPSVGAEAVGAMTPPQYAINAFNRFPALPPSQR
mgnify:FL=1